MHVPVLLDECLRWLAPGPGGRFIDCTVNGGGHSAALLKATSPNGDLLGLDADPAALAVAGERLAAFGPRAHLVHANFRSLAEVAHGEGFHDVDGVLLDLGLSSAHLEHSGRGFSFRREEPLDMRFDPTRGPTASELLTSAPREHLEYVIRTYGEEPRARVIAARIEAARQKNPLTTTGELVALVASAVGAGSRRVHPATRTFQALRIAVNDELNALAEALPQALALLRRGGRLAVISFHSLEDRIVKGFCRREAGLDAPSLRDLPIPTRCLEPGLKSLTPRPISPSPAEIQQNPRSRSGRLRVVERV